MAYISGYTGAEIDEAIGNVADHEIRITTLEDKIQYVVESWDDVQEIVRRGLAPTAFEVGDQLVATYNGTEIVWDIIGINHDTPTDTEKTHSLTIQAHDCIMDCEWDAEEPTNPDTSRQQYGNNRYIHSNIKQWLNSEEASFNWVSQHAYDEPSTASPYDGPGFLYNLDPDLKAVIGAVDKQVAQATIDGGGQDTFSDKVFLLSRVEVYGGDEGVVTGESPYEFYENLASAPESGDLDGRIKYLSGSPRYWWLRSPNTGNSNNARNVNTPGNINNNNAINDNGLAPD